MPKKGMSQTIALVIAASVLMMTALIAIFMVQGGLDDTGNSLDNTGCTTAIQAKCPTPPDSTKVIVPSTCANSDQVETSAGSSAKCSSLLGSSN